MYVGLRQHTQAYTCGLENKEVDRIDRERIKDISLKLDE